MHQFLEKVELGIKHLAFAIQIGLNLSVSVAKRYNGSHIESNTIFLRADVRGNTVSRISSMLKISSPKVPLCLRFLPKVKFPFFL